MLGQRLSHYVIEQKLGEGGMGVVYRARDEKLQRDVALKFLEAALSTGSSASHERALQEARAISALNHPNICTVYEVGEVDGRPFIAMEFVEGRALSLEIPSVGLSLNQVERYGMQLADALAHAHSRGVIHRDLKPSNVMITPSGLLKVLDFGISQRFEPGRTGDGTTVIDQSWESQHTFTGTLPYVAPEILKGQEADVRSDIWSLGVLLYEMAAGQRPFRGATAFELSAAILRERAPEISPSFPPVLTGVIEKALDKDPGQRYQSAGEVKAALEAASTATRTHDYATEKIKPPDPATVFSARNIAILCVVLALAGGALYWRNGHGAKNAHKPPVPGAIQSIAVLPLENLSGDPKQDYFADGMTDALITELSQIRKLRVISRTSVMQYKHTQKSLDPIAQELNVDAIVEGSVLRDGDRVRISAKLFQTNMEGALWAENFERNFTDILTLQSDVATAIARGIQVELSAAEQNQLARSRSVVPEAYDSYLRGKAELEKRTPAALQDAANYFEKAIEKDGTFAAAYAGLADTTILMVTNHTSDPSLVAKAKSAAEKALQLDDRLAQAHTSLAAIRFWSLEGGDIEGEFQKAIALDPSYAQGIHWYALYLAAVGRKEESIREIKLAREIDPKSLIISANLGFIHYLAGEYNHAEEAEKNVIRIDPSFVPAHIYLGQIYAEKKQYEAAVDEFRTALALSPGDPEPQVYLAYVNAISGEKKEAEEMLKELQSPERNMSASAYDFAVVHAGFRDVGKTLDWLEKSYAERDGKMVNLGVHPQFVFLRKEPRFQSLVNKIWGVKSIGDAWPGLLDALPKQDLSLTMNKSLA